MPLEVQSGPDAAVAHQRLNDLRVGTFADEQRGVGVSEGMERDTGEEDPTPRLA